ncbi:hypothetical protein NOGI109294_13795 [Nocardiopsis gilva]|nr:hypothetical protein [Nocardiopsis gilva]
MPDMMDRFKEKFGLAKAAPIATAIIVGFTLTACFSGSDEQAGRESEQDQERNENEQAGGGTGAVPEGYQEIDAGLISYSVPADWEPPEEENDELTNAYEGVDEDGTIVMTAGLVPINGVDETTESAKAITRALSGKVTLGNRIREMDRDQEIEVPGARSAARNDYLVEQSRIDEIDFSNVIDIALITEDNEGVAFRLNVADDAIDSQEREKIVNSIRVN